MYRKSALEIANDFKEGRVSATEITTYFLKRVQAKDQELNSFLHVMEARALAKAKELDEKRAKGEALGKLAGVPVSLKDNLNVKGVKTTCSSKILENYTSPYDATVTELIEQEDGIILGKTNLDEFAMGSTNENSSYGRSLNPWNPNFVSGGSSGGSTASVAAGFAKLSLGSDTGGSIRLPASFCGIVGYKPTYGRVSRYGLTAFGSSLDQIGPLARTVEDAALMMEVIGKHCKRDSTSLDWAAENYTSELEQPIQGKVVGVPYQLIEQMASEPRAHFESSIEKLKEMGMKVVDINLDALKHAVPVYYILAPAEASTNLARFDGIMYTKRSENSDSLQELYCNSRKEGFGTEVKQRILLGTYVLSADSQNAYYKQAQRVRTLIVNAMKKAFEVCDVIAMPTSAYSAFDAGSIQDPLSLYLQDIYTIPANLAGTPAISIPSGFTSDQRPLGLQLICPRKEDHRLFRFAYHAEQALNFNPNFPPDYDKENLA